METCSTRAGFVTWLHHTIVRGITTDMRCYSGDNTEVNNQDIKKAGNSVQLPHDGLRRAPFKTEHTLRRRMGIKEDSDEKHNVTAQCSRYCSSVRRELSAYGRAWWHR